MLNFSTDQWIIVLLVFVLGLLVGGFIFGRRPQVEASLQ